MPLLLGVLVVRNRGPCSVFGGSITARENTAAVETECFFNNRAIHKEYCKQKERATCSHAAGCCYLGNTLRLRLFVSQ